MSTLFSVHHQKSTKTKSLQIVHVKSTQFSYPKQNRQTCTQNNITKYRITIPTLNSKKVLCLVLCTSSRSTIPVSCMFVCKPYNVFYPIHTDKPKRKVHKISFRHLTNPVSKIFLCSFFCIILFHPSLFTVVNDRCADLMGSQASTNRNHCITIMQ